MNTGCEFFADALVERAAGLLEAERDAAVDAHLAGCADCRGSLAAIQALRQAPLAVPDGLEDRIRQAVRAGAGAGTQRRRRMGRGPWMLPLAAAAAAVVLWFGVGLPGGSTNGVDAALGVFQEYTPYGAWPGAEGVVAGETMLSDLSIEELEQLLREMQT